MESWISWMVVVSVTSSSDEEVVELVSGESNTSERRIRFAGGDANMLEADLVF